MYRTLSAAALCCVAFTSSAQDNNPFSGARSFEVTMERVETGIASWYGNESGAQTASGERFDANKMTCAMRSYKRGQQRSVRVTVIATGRSASCRINDYGPAAWTGRIIDVSEGMARVLGFHALGVAKVSIE